MKKFILQIIILFCFTVLVSAGDAVDEMLAAYGDGNYAKARKLAEKISGKPEAKLVSALCMIFDPVKQDMAGGMVVLESLYRDKNLLIPIWTQAALTYGRLAQLIQERKELYGGLASNVDTGKIFQEIIDKSPESRETCTALFFDFTKDLDCDDEKKINATFEKLEAFCRDFKGKQEYLVPIHLLAEQKYITIKKDYSSAVEHLGKAYGLGIANPRDSEIALYRVGRIYDLKLKKREEAVKYYNEFLKKYPESGYAPSIKMFLKQLKPQSMEANNGQR